MPKSQRNQPPKCQPTLETASIEIENFYTYMKIFPCDKSSCEKKFTFDKITENDIDCITSKTLYWMWKRENPPLSLKDDVLPFYKEVKEKCFKSNDELQHVCETEKGNKLFTDIVNNYVIPKVAPCSIYVFSYGATNANYKVRVGMDVLPTIDSK